MNYLNASWQHLDQLETRLEGKNPKRRRDELGKKHKAILQSSPMSVNHIARLRQLACTATSLRYSAVLC